MFSYGRLPNGQQFFIFPNESFKETMEFYLMETLKQTPEIFFEIV